MADAIQANTHCRYIQYLSNITSLQLELVCPVPLKLVLGVVRTLQLHLTRVALVSKYFDEDIGISPGSPDITSLHRDMVGGGWTDDEVKTFTV